MQLWLNIWWVFTFKNENKKHILIKSPQNIPPNLRRHSLSLLLVLEVALKSSFMSLVALLWLPQCLELTENVSGNFCQIETWWYVHVHLGTGSAPCDFWLAPLQSLNDPNGKRFELIQDRGQKMTRTMRWICSKRREIFWD